MGDTLSAGEFDCRFIAEGPHRPGSFSRFVNELGIKLPSGIGVREAVQYGWIEPCLRIAIPREYFDDWTEYPLWSRDSKARPEHSWADWVVRGEFAFSLMFPGKGRLPADWYLHPFDTQAPEVREVFDHSIPTDAEPEAFEHARGGLIYPFVDFFHYWEAYRLIESLRAAKLFQPLLNTPTASAAAANISTHISDCIAWSNASLQGVRRSYEAAKPAFEWVSFYRTLVGASVHARIKRPNQREACKRLAARIGKDVDALKKDVRDTLLALWKDWHVFDSLRIPAGAERHLQQDLKRAIDFISSVSGVAIDYRDTEYWYITDRNPRRWDQLYEALPFEHWIAQETFARRAALYLTRAQRLRFSHPIPTTESTLRVAMLSRWPESYGFRRFTILFKRLHDLLNKDRGVLVTFTDQNIVDYMILGCLVVERMIAEWWRRRNPTAPKLAVLDVMLVDLANELTRLLKVRPVDQLLKQYSKSTKLHSLKVGDRLPLLSDAVTTVRQFVFRTLHNLRVLRNYSAHHDCLDFELSYGREGARAMRVIVSTVSLMLALPL